MSTAGNQYNDLRIFDKDAQDIFDVAIQSLRLRLPGWEPREDATEVILIEAMALEVAEASFAINRLPSTVMMSLLSLFGLTRHEGSFPTTTITLNASSPGSSIPAGTKFVLNTTHYDTPVVFTTTETAYFTNTTIADVAAEANVLTNDLYAVPTGTPVYAVATNNALESAMIGTTIVGGSTPETDKEWMDRSVSHFRRLVSTLVTPEHFRLAVLDYETVTRAKVLDLYDPAVGKAGSSPGHITIALYGQMRMLTEQEKAAIYTDLRSKALASLQIHLIDPTITDVDISATIGYFSTYVKSDVDASIRKALINYLSSAQWDTATKIRRNELITEISNVPGVDYVGELKTPAADVSLGVVPTIARIGTITLNPATN